MESLLKHSGSADEVGWGKLWRECVFFFEISNTYLWKHDTFENWEFHQRWRSSLQFWVLRIHLTTCVKVHLLLASPQQVIQVLWAGKNLCFCIWRLFTVRFGRFWSWFWPSKLEMTFLMDIMDPVQNVKLSSAGTIFQWYPLIPQGARLASGIQRQRCLLHIHLKRQGIQFRVSNHGWWIWAENIHVT